MSDCVECMSLCCVWEDSNQTKWLSRLADLKNGHLDYPIIDDNLPKVFGNRDRLYYKNGPSKNGVIGIWRWIALPRDSDSEKDYIESEFQYDLHPARFVEIKCISTLEQLSKLLLEGVSVHNKYECDVFFAFEKAAGVYEGVICEAKELIFEDKIYLKKDVCSLPIYQFEQSNIITITNSMRFIKNVPLPPISEKLSIGSLDDNIKTIIMERMTWPLYKKCIGCTKTEWRNCKVLFEQVCGESLYKTVADKMGYTLTEATELVNNFTDRANLMFTEGDIDSEVLAKIAMNHDGLRTQCEATVEEHWKDAYVKEIAMVQAEIDRKRQDAENNLNKYKDQLKKVMADNKVAKADHKKILTDILEAQGKLDQLMKKIEEYEALGANTVQAMQKKIVSAQRDMADFIAELSTYIPWQLSQSSSMCETRSANRWTFTSGMTYGDTDNMEECGSWKDTLVVLWDNLQFAGVSSQWISMLSSFLYSAYLNRMPLLLAGPNAEAIANALSMAVYGKKIDILRCCGEQDMDAVSSFLKADIAAVQNPFHPDWVSCISNINNSFSFWIHPFTEDLQIEPRSLYYYAYPIFTECFVYQPASMQNMDAGYKTDKYFEFKSDETNRAKMGLIKKLGMSHLMRNRLEKVLADAKCMNAMSDSSMEYIFGILPMCVLNGKQQVLTELLDNERNITMEVKEELQRYIEE